MITKGKDCFYTIGIITALLLITFTTIKLLNSRELFTIKELEAVYAKIHEQKLVISKKVADYIKGDTEYVNYLKFLSQNGNVSTKLIAQDVFYEMRVTAKTGKLTPDIVYSYIKNEK